MAVAEEENYKNVIEMLKKEYNLKSKIFHDYDQKFNVWFEAYPAAKKQTIIREHEKNWSPIYKVYHKIFKDDVWNEYRHHLDKLRNERFQAEGKYNEMYVAWTKHSDDYRKLALKYENIDESMPGLILYQRSHEFFKAKVWPKMLDDIIQAGRCES